MNEDKLNRVSPQYGLLATSANIDLLAKRLDKLTIALLDDSPDRDLKHSAFDSLYTELSELHGLACDVREGIQWLMDKQLGGEVDD